MKSLSSELAKIVDMPLATLVGSYSYVVYGGHTVAIEGVRSIGNYDSNNIIVSVSKAISLSIVGNNLTVRLYGGGSMVVSGVICGVSVL